MFSALSQGSPVYLLDKTSSLEYKIGEIVGVSQPRIIYNNFGQQNTIDLKVRIDGEIKDFNSIPSINSIATYNNNSFVISETKQGIQNEVEGILQNSKQIIENIDKYKSNVTQCEEILKQLNPQFAKDKERDDRLFKLENRFDGVESKLDKIFDLIKK